MLDGAELDATRAMRDLIVWARPCLQTTANGATVEFIDASYADIGDPDGVEVRTLQAEHHLARSALIAAVGERLGCRDHDETWEHLFEVRSPEALADWRRFFADTEVERHLGERQALPVAQHQRVSPPTTP